MKTFVTSDHHFGHRNIIKYEDRPLDHERIMVERWNEVVGEDDVVLHLGDFALSSKAVASGLMSVLKGSKYLQRGNHDPKSTQRNLDVGFLEVYTSPRVVLVGTQAVVLSHYPLQASEINELNRKHHGGVINICGHSHSNIPLFTKDHINVSVENTDYYPVDLVKIVQAYKRWEAQADVTLSSGNVFADLGLPNADKLLAEAEKTSRL